MMKKETLMFILAIKLKELRLSKSLSLKDLARKSNFSISYLNEIEKAKKFPKLEKLALLAGALGVEYEDLISTKVDPKIRPLIDIYQSEFLKKLPLKEFGMSESDLFDLFSYDPFKFSSFIMTIYELVRSYSMDLKSVTQAALRAYQESHNNYFPEIEVLANKLRSQNKIPMDKNVDNDNLKSILIDQLGYEIDEKIMATNETLSTIRSISKAGNPNKLLINPRLSHRQKLFVLAKEIGSALYWQDLPDLTSNHDGEHSYQREFNDFKASYFGGALLIPEQEIIKDLGAFFKQKTFRPELLENMMEKYDSSTELFFHRLAQILPRFFNLDHLFFLRANHDLSNDFFSISKEMHLMKLHKPHATKLSEHYCRRWITIDLQKKLLKSKDAQILGAQKSHMLGSPDQYLCFSIARASKLKAKTNTCLTIGVLINEHAREEIKFMDDPAIELKSVGQTCERCEITDCKERVVPAEVYEYELAQKERQDSIQKILDQI